MCTIFSCLNCFFLPVEDVIVEVVEIVEISGVTTEVMEVNADSEVDVDVDKSVIVVISV